MSNYVSRAWLQSVAAEFRIQMSGLETKKELTAARKIMESFMACCSWRNPRFSKEKFREASDYDRPPVKRKRTRRPSTITQDRKPRRILEI
jgi:hypothetical protein